MSCARVFRTHSSASGLVVCTALYCTALVCLSVCLHSYQEAGIRVEHIVPHGSYLVNLCAPDPDVLQRSRARLLDELQRCERLGLTRYNVHPGSTCGQATPAEGVARIAESINWALAHTRSVCIRMHMHMPILMLYLYWTVP